MVRLRVCLTCFVKRTPGILFIFIDYSSFSSSHDPHFHYVSWKSGPMFICNPTDKQTNKQSNKQTDKQSKPKHVCVFLRLFVCFPGCLPGGQGGVDSAPLLHHYRLMSPAAQHLSTRQPERARRETPGARQQPHLKQHHHWQVRQLQRGTANTCRETSWWETGENRQLETDDNRKGRGHWLTCSFGWSQHCVVDAEQEVQQSLPGVSAHHSAVSGQCLNCT